jgi:hypothetical protein
MGAFQNKQSLSCGVAEIALHAAHQSAIEGQVLMGADAVSLTVERSEEGLCIS